MVDKSTGIKTKNVEKQHHVGPLSWHLAYGLDPPFTHSIISDSAKCWSKKCHEYFCLSEIGTPKSDSLFSYIYILHYITVYYNYIYNIFKCNFPDFPWPEIWGIFPRYGIQPSASAFRWCHVCPAPPRCERNHVTFGCLRVIFRFRMIYDDFGSYSDDFWKIGWFHDDFGSSSDFWKTR